MKIFKTIFFVYFSLSIALICMENESSNEANHNEESCESDDKEEYEFFEDFVWPSGCCSITSLIAYYNYYLSSNAWQELWDKCINSEGITENYTSTGSWHSLCGPPCKSDKCVGTFYLGCSDCSQYFGPSIKGPLIAFTLIPPCIVFGYLVGHKTRLLGKKVKSLFSKCLDCFHNSKPCKEKDTGG